MVYRASALGGCMTGLAAARQGYPKEPLPAKALEVFERGNEMEEWYATTFKLRARQRQVILPVTSKIRVVGHIDGIRTVGRMSPIVEVKTVNASDFERWTPQWFDTSPLFRKYTWQIAVMMLGAGNELELVLINPESSKLKTYYFETPPHTLEEIHERVFAAEALAREETLVCANGEFFCPYKSLHQGVEVVDEPEFSELAAEYLRRKAIVDADQAGLKVLRGRLEGMLDGRGKVALMSGHTVTRAEVEVKEHVVKGSSQVRLTVKGPK